MRNKPLWVTLWTGNSNFSLLKKPYSTQVKINIEINLCFEQMTIRVRCHAKFLPLLPQDAFSLANKVITRENSSIVKYSEISSELDLNWVRRLCFFFSAGYINVNKNHKFLRHALNSGSCKEHFDTLPNTTKSRVWNKSIILAVNCREWEKQSAFNFAICNPGILRARIVVSKRCYQNSHGAARRLQFFPRMITDDYKLVYGRKCIPPLQRFKVFLYARF